MRFEVLGWGWEIYVFMMMVIVVITWLCGYDDNIFDYLLYCMYFLCFY